MPEERDELSPEEWDELSPEERTKSKECFDATLSLYDELGPSDKQPRLPNQTPVKSAALIRELLRQSFDQLGYDNVLRYFMTWLETGTTGQTPAATTHFPAILEFVGSVAEWSDEEKTLAVQRVDEIAEHIVHHFLLPSKLFTLPSSSILAAHFSCLL